MAAFLIGQPGPKFQAKASAGIDGARSLRRGGLNQLAQGGTKPEPRFDHLQDTPLAAARRQGYAAEVHVDNESKWATVHEIVSEQRAELVGIPTSLGVSPATPKLQDLLRG
jgi:hypothetical protein